MSTAFGFSVGEGSVRIIRIVDELPESGRLTEQLGSGEPRFSSRSLPADGSSPQRVAAVAAVDLSRPGGPPMVIASPSRFAATVAAELRSAGLSDFRLVSEAEAVLEFVSASGAVRGFRNLLVYDLGKTGLTVSVVDIATGRMLSSIRTTELSGDLLDQLVADQLRNSAIDAGPEGSGVIVDLPEYGRTVKEALSRTLEYRESESSPVVLTRFDFEEVVRDPVIASMSTINEVALQAERRPDVVVMVGGGARIPLIEVVLRRLRIPVIRPAEPELVVGKGAALWARIREVPTRAIPIVTAQVADPVHAWTRSDDDDDFGADIPADIFAEPGEVADPDELTSESVGVQSSGRQSKIPIVLGIAMSAVAVLSMLAWLVFRPFSDDVVADVSQVGASSVVSSVAPTTTAQAVDPTTAAEPRSRSYRELSWKY
ncbi:Hsp70 family protein [Rhodococcus sp. ARC_M6]|uniref:Hsp70 family protein n=1 Tax=Rhodococcus sp. ARC_M6 TaxID=2928852 RepID=UPI001FB3C405|nr:Hsp70 family protein [Rhodococcus sp. ARC_M6]MCJ0904100.1 Hsp70 family protein [Rhodococcus sp. ARC_M6]